MTNVFLSKKVQNYEYAQYVFGLAHQVARTLCSGSRVPALASGGGVLGQLRRRAWQRLLNAGRVELARAPAALGALGCRAEVCMVVKIAANI